MKNLVIITEANEPDLIAAVGGGVFVIELAIATGYIRTRLTTEEAERLRNWLTRAIREANQ